MPISRKLETAMEGSSFIRRMFEEGAKLKQERGADNVFDFSLGNPVAEPPQEVLVELEKLITDKTGGQHRYMENAGFHDTRKAVAEQRSKESGLLFEADNIIMTVGAGGGLNVVLKTLLDPGDEVIVIAPYFPEYRFYIDNHGGKMVVSESDESFGLDIEAIIKNLTDKTRALILNSPNNPTGRIYKKEELDRLGQILAQQQSKTGRAVYIVMDEPYAKLVYDGLALPSIFLSYDNTIAVTSHSKDLCLPGERIGHIALSPSMNDKTKVVQGLIMANRILGFVNAPALFQRLSAKFQDFMPDMSQYTKNRNFLAGQLEKAGYEFIRPDGGFYLFVKSPLPDEMEFVSILARHGILVVPGRGFGRAGFFRIAYCVPYDVCEKSLNGFTMAIKEISTGKASHE